MANTKQTAVEAYDERQRDIGVLLDCIQQELEAHREKGKTERITWAHSGDLGHTKEQLKQVLMFLMNADCEEEFERLIEDHLEELRA